MKLPKVLRITALTIDCIVPAIATMTQFPVWVHKGAKETVSGVAMCLIIVCCIPFWKQIKEYMKSPAAPVLWAVLFGVCAVLGEIIDQITVIAFAGLIANLIGSVIYHLSRRIEENGTNSAGDESE